MAVHAQLAFRVPRTLAGIVLAASAVLALTAPSAAATATATKPDTSAVGPYGVQAKAAAVADANATKGTLLWGRDPDTERPMGSITKVMTALLVIKAGDLDRKITIPYAVIAYVDEYDASNAGLIPGDTLTTRELLEALLLPSGCDAAYALAEAYGPGIPAFVARMNAMARRLGMTRTHFSNFDGLPWPTEYSTYSTAANLITLGRAAMALPVLRSIVDQRTYWLPAGSGHHAYFWRNTDPLLGVYPGAIGIKTGYTLAAGHCLLFEATRHGLVLIGVTLDSPGPGTTVTASDATRILNWAFSAHS